MPTRIAWLACSLVMFSASADATVHHVDCAGGADYLTIQAAVDAAANGDTILVAPCIYEEKVAVIDKHVTIQGAGWETTEVTSGGSGFTVTFDGLPTSAPESYLTDIRVTHAAPIDGCVEVGSATVVLERCHVDQSVGIGCEQGGTAEIRSCTIGGVSVGGIHGRAVVSDSEVGLLVAGGGYDGVYWWGHAETSGNTIGTLWVTGGIADSEGDEVELVQYEGHLDCYSTLTAVDGSFGEVRLNGAWDVTLERCVMESVVYHPDIESYLVMSGCLLLGDFRAVDEGWYGVPLDAALTHNTILGDLSHALPSCPVSGDALSNIVMGSIDITVADWLELRSNDILGEINAPGATLVDNISEDPLFCEEETDDYTLQDCSPCLGAAHDGGDIGAFGEGCECDVAVEDASWGSIKALYR